MARKAIIIGAGPAGLTAAYELLLKTDIIPIILEKSGDIGGLSKTVNFKGNRIDIGGHRFFSKSDRIVKWWLNILPLQTDLSGEINLRYHNQDHKIVTEAAVALDNDRQMLVRSRKSRIYYLKKFFSYPVSLSIDTLGKLGPVKIAAILSSYMRARIFPIKNEKTLEDFFINRFGENLYKTFFKDYTEKVWGKSCREISSEWGAQRIKGLSVKKTIGHALNKLLLPGRSRSLRQKNTETSLIERFMYPKYGPGQLWEEVARIVKEKGGEIHFNQDVKGIQHNEKHVQRIQAADMATGLTSTYTGDFFFSTMPVKDLVSG
ncbi:MAG: FAD-dependent oxidoreductase, partial [Gemmatimonadaceae bacterium]|nr:FAD-dependent oxidoreductase [Chitinophagaceae bacterium]